MNIKARNLIEDHSALIIEALDCYRREVEDAHQEMTKAATECQAGYDQVKDDPAARAALDAPAESPGMISVAPTAEGLKHMAQMFTESASKYSQKLAALTKITEALENQEG
jgi:hypothetical protein